MGSPSAAASYDEIDTDPFAEDTLHKLEAFDPAGALVQAIV